MPTWKTVAKVVFAVIAVTAAMFFRLGRNGSYSDLGFRLGMAIVLVVAIGIVAPRFFLGKQDGADYSDEIDALHKKQQGEAEKRKWE
jgi:hypothetical protein